MKYRLQVVLLALFGIGVLLWCTSSRHITPRARSLPDTAARMEEVPQVPAESPQAEVQGSAAAADTAPAAALPQGAVPQKPKPLSLAAAAEPPAGPEVGPGLTPLTVLENMRSVFRQYSSRFGGNPVGNNSEITAALNGENSKQVVFLNPDDGMRLNEHGELVDNWGTPFFFHQLSATQMEIRSAGPDRRMWTRDDLVIK